VKYKDLLELVAADRVVSQYLSKAKKFLADKVRQGEYPYVPDEWVDFIVDNAPDTHYKVDLLVEMIKAGVERIPVKLWNAVVSDQDVSTHSLFRIACTYVEAGLDVPSSLLQILYRRSAPYYAKVMILLGKEIPQAIVDRIARWDQSAYEVAYMLIKHDRPVPTEIVRAVVKNPEWSYRLVLRVTRDLKLPEDRVPQEIRESAKQRQRQGQNSK
jgi:hypothetical protein